MTFILLFVFCIFLIHIYSLLGMKDILTTGFDYMEKNYPEILKHLFIVHGTEF